MRVKRKRGQLPERGRRLTLAQGTIIAALLTLFGTLVNLVGNYVKPAPAAPTIIIVVPSKLSAHEPAFGSTGRRVAL